MVALEVSTEHQSAFSVGTSLEFIRKIAFWFLVRERHTPSPGALQAQPGIHARARVLEMAQSHTYSLLGPRFEALIGSEAVMFVPAIGDLSLSFDVEVVHVGSKPCESRETDLQLLADDHQFLVVALSVMADPPRVGVPLHPVHSVFGSAVVSTLPCTSSTRHGLHDRQNLGPSWR